MDKIENFIKNDKLKFITICIASFVFIVGLIMVIINVGDTYAESTSDYSCPLGNYSSDGSTSIPASFYDDNSGYFCRINKVGVSSANYTVGTSLIHDIGTPKNESACYKYLTEMGYTYLERDDAGCYYKAINKNVDNIGKCYQCNSPDILYEWTNSPSAACGAGWHERTDITSPSQCVTYTVSYDGNGGSGVPDSQMVKGGETLTLSETAPTLEGYRFVGWSNVKTATTAQYQPGNNFTPTSNTTLYAVWRQKHKVIYDGNGGIYTGDDWEYGSTSLIDIFSGVYGKLYFVYENSELPFERTGYTFVGWKDENGNSVAIGQHDSWPYDRDVTLYAQWTPNSSGGQTPTPVTYTVTYDANGGEGAPASQTVKEGETLVLSETEPTSEGHTFLGWSKDKDATTAEYSSGGNFSTNSNVTLFAVWSKHDDDTYTVTYDANGGEDAPTSQTAKAGETLVLSETEPTREGHTFLGWNEDGAATDAKYQSGDDYTVTSDVTLYAIWGENTVADEEIKDPNDIGTGDALILIVWAIGLGALGYSAYYFMKRKNNI